MNIVFDRLTTGDLLVADKNDDESVERIGLNRFPVRGGEARETGGRRKRFSRLDGRRQEPLELYARGPARAHGPRSPGHRVYPISGRGPGKLHGDQHVRRDRFAGEAGHGLRGKDNDLFRRFGRLRPRLLARLVQNALRARRLPEDHKRSARELRRRVHRDNEFGVRFVHVHPAERRAAGVHDSAATDFLHGTRLPRTLPEPGGRVTHFSRPQRAQDVHGTVHQRVVAPVHVVTAQIPNVVRARQGPATF